ncbi:recombinase XerD [Microbacterium kunmingense]|uniref:recombinase XerD n=1 Tax=Microbacterium kunmingense TaxID=2915939 RepID=UPI002003E8EB|nr:recombinase XerD [Microbacterium kunmingense]
MTVTTRPPRECARCTRTGVRFAVTWPEGSVCRCCYQRATRTHGTCTGCGEQRLLPGLVDGRPSCTVCAGIPKDFHCTRCGREDEPVRVGLCAHCCLSDDLTALLTDTTGQVSPTLLPLFTALTQQTHARSARTWLTVNPHATKLLQDLARGTVPLQHATFTEHAHPSKVAFLRELCIEHGLLEPVSLDIERFQTWLDGKLRTADPADARLIRQYARWVHLNRMQHLAGTGALKKGTFLAAKQSTTVALEFVQHIRASGLTPATCTQACVDDWLATGPTTRSLARGFVRWASAHRHLPPVVFPYRVARTEPVITQQQRLGHIARLLVPNDQLATDERVAALLLLLYAQPLARIAGMRRHQIRDEHGLLTVTFTGDALTIPAPFAAIVRDHLAAPPNQNTAAHRDSPRLFPGRRPGQHLHQNTIMNKLRDAGIDLRGARNAALRALVIDLPAPVVADSLNYSYTITDKHRRNAGATFLDYATLRTTHTIGIPTA